MYGNGIKCKMKTVDCPNECVPGADLCVMHIDERFKYAEPLDAEDHTTDLVDH